MPTHAIDMRLILLTQIEVNPDQPRRTFDATELDSLKMSIQERGLINPVSVQELEADHYRLIAGERRLRAVQALGWDKIDARVWPASMSSQELELLAMVENLQRTDLNPIEEALAYQRLAKAPYNLTQEEIAQQTGRNSRSSVAESLALLTLPKEVQEIVERSTISVSHCREILKLSDKSSQISLAKKAATGEWGVKRTAEEVAKRLAKGNRSTSVPKPQEPSVKDSSVDPLLGEWSQVLALPSLPDTYWEVSRGKRKFTDGVTRVAWNFAVSTPEVLPRQEMAAWFRKLAEVMETCTVQDDKVQSIMERMAPTSVAEAEALSKESERARLPQSDQDQAEYEAAAVLNPAAAYAWIFGPQSLMAQKLAGATWADLNMPDPLTGGRQLLDGLRQFRRATGTV